MRLRLQPDTSSPVPLYHQIAEAIRYNISVGAVRPGEVLPPLRTAAREWGVNLHTVRRAYAQLADSGLVRIRRPLGAVVLGGTPARAASTQAARLQRFVCRIRTEARDRYGLTPLELARLLTVPPATRRLHRAVVVECSETQCADLASQLERQWGVTADPWCLARPEDLPEGDIIATLFHYNDIRRRWPHRLERTHFLAIHPDPALPESVAARMARNAPAELLVCEREPAMLGMITADLSRLFDRTPFDLAPRLIENAAQLLDDDDPRLRLVAPRIWGSLSTAQRADRRVMEVRYVFVQDQIEQLAGRLGWSRRPLEKEQTA